MALDVHRSRFTVQRSTFGVRRLAAAEGDWKSLRLASSNPSRPKTVCRLGNASFLRTDLTKSKDARKPKDENSNNMTEECYLCPEP